MVQYRTFRNTDPPHLVEVWNETFTGRGAAPLKNTTQLEQFILAKPLFDPAGLILAEENGQCLGFAHASICPDAPCNNAGVVCAIGVRPAFRRRGIGRHLLQFCEAFLAQRGARTMVAGPYWPLNPFYLGLYGGCDSPGFLKSDPIAEPFFCKLGYRIERRFLIFHKRLDIPLRVTDPRFIHLRQRFPIQGCVPRRLNGYWQECILGFVEPVELAVEDKQSGKIVARALVWEMEGYTAHWNGPAIGIVRFEVDPAYRRKGVGKYLLMHLIRQVKEQFFQIAEVQLDENNGPAIQFLNSLGFDHVDTGQVFVKA